MNRIAELSDNARARAAHGLIWLGAAWVLMLVVRNAWLSDDAYITLRSVDNLVHGRGITWNPGQRVQGFSHPLWFGLLSMVQLLFGEPYYATLGLSLGLAAYSLVQLVRGRAPDNELALVMLLALSGSKCFVDFSSSGLENVLSHVLLLAWLSALWRFEHAPERDARSLDVLAGLVLVTRLDLALLVLPAQLWVARRRVHTLGRRAALRGALWASGPQLAWLLFSLAYFGFPLPNTAYAKLNVALPLAERVAQGGFYLLSFITDDPVSAVLLFAGLAAGLRATPAARSVCAGVGLYLAYLGWIGGDFMLGRFLSAPLVVTLALLLRTALDARLQLGACALFALCALGTAAPPWLTGRPAGDAHHEAAPLQRFRDVTDERRFYFRDTGLLYALRGAPMPRGGWVAEGLKLQGTRGKVVYAAGIRGFFAGHETWLIDIYALTDPFLAQLKVVPLMHWKSGHYPRELPEGYADTIVTGEDHLRDPKLQALYADVVLASQGPLWSAERWAAIARLNTGADAVPVIDYRNLPGGR